MLSDKSHQVSAFKSYFDQRKKQFALDSNELNEVAVFPKNALIELTNACNHACVFCKNPDQSRLATQLSFNVYEKFVSQAVPLGLEEIGLYATGEPFMTKNIETYIKLANNYGVKRIYITTNGALATLAKVKKCVDAGLASIKFSINAGNPFDYLKVHGFDDFNRVLKNVKDIYEWKTKSNANLQLLGSCVMIPQLKNTKKEHQKIFLKYFEDIEYVVADSQCGQAFQLPFSKDYISPVFGDLEQKAQPSKPCQLPWIRAHLTAEGFLTACCGDYDLDLVFGDIKQQDLETAWNNEVVKSLRRKHLQNELDGLLCDQCLNNRAAPFKPLTDVQKKEKSVEQRERERDKLMSRFIKINKIGV